VVVFEVRVGVVVGPGGQRFAGGALLELAVGAAELFFWSDEDALARLEGVLRVRRGGLVVEERTALWLLLGVAGVVWTQVDDGVGGRGVLHADLL
jgi:hypothetical protein